MYHEKTRLWSTCTSWWWIHYTHPGGSSVKSFLEEMITENIGGSKGGARDARPPLGSKFFHFHAVFGKKLKNNSTFGSWRPPWGKSWIRHWKILCFTMMCYAKIHLEAYINTQYICLKNNIAQFYSILERTELRLKFSNMCTWLRLISCWKICGY